jgi:hypothetical protein
LAEAAASEVEDLGLAGGDGAGGEVGVDGVAVHESQSSSGASVSSIGVAVCVRG